MMNYGKYTRRAIEDVVKEYLEVELDDLQVIMLPKLDLCSRIQITGTFKDKCYSVDFSEYKRFKAFFRFLERAYSVKILVDFY